MKNNKINETADSVAIHMLELLEDTVDWQMDDLPPSARGKLIKLSVKKLQSLISDKWWQYQRLKA
tara:strand:+ start:526 stop:720 length:195 start_codon:yes stop_codon:yes gene_type:complete